MKYPERTAIAAAMPFESRLGFVAFCVERCLKEARRHPSAAAQLDRLPPLEKGLELLWARAESGRPAPDAQVQEILDFISTFEQVDATGERVVYAHDVTIVQAARMLRKGLVLLQDPTKDGRYVAGAFEGVVQAVGVIYADYRAARAAEVEIADAALLRLQAWGDRPFSRDAFEGIAEWPRGELSRKYASGGVTGEGEADDDE